MSNRGINKLAKKRVCDKVIHYSASLKYYFVNL